MANEYDEICCSEVYFVLLFARESARMANTYDQICCSEVYFVLFFCKGKCSRGPHIWPNILPRSGLCIVFCKGWRGGVASSGLAPGRLGEGVFINREQ